MPPVADAIGQVSSHKGKRRTGLTIQVRATKTAVENVLAEITPTVLLKAYACGIFPMAESADDPSLYWIEPHLRGIIPLNDFHVSRSLAKVLRRGDFEVRVNHDFNAVISACAEPGQGRRKTWINRPIRRLYRDLFDLGHCHTVEVRRDDRLIGGLYGVSLGGAFFGESMFHRERDASKIALVYLVWILKENGYGLLDTQFVTDHLRRFGAVEVPRKAYHKLLEAALAIDGQFDVPASPSVASAASGAGSNSGAAIPNSSEEILQSVSQTS